MQYEMHSQKIAKNRHSCGYFGEVRFTRNLHADYDICDLKMEMKIRWRRHAILRYREQTSVTDGGSQIQDLKDMGTYFDLSSRASHSA